MLMTEVLEDVLGERERVAGLSGPNHAEEVSRASRRRPSSRLYDAGVGEPVPGHLHDALLPRLHEPRRRGRRAGGASKNVIAIAAGISDGLGYGDNTKATLMTRGLAEMSRLGARLGANPLTYMGLAGMGDLIATCTSRHSRNRGLGELIAKGGTMQEFYDETHMVAEGAVACITVDELGKREGLELPITQQVRAILYEGRPVSRAPRRPCSAGRPKTSCTVWGSWTTSRTSRATGSRRGRHHPHRPSILSADFTRLGEAIALHRGRRRRPHPRRRDGRPLRAEPHDRPARGHGAQEGRHQAARRAPHDRQRRRDGATGTSTPAPTWSRCTPRRRRTCTGLCPAIRAAGR